MNENLKKTPPEKLTETQKKALEENDPEKKTGKAKAGAQTNATRA